MGQTNEPFTDGQWSQVKQELGVTPRQMQVGEAFFHGKKKKDIGIELGISKHTVDRHWRDFRSRAKVADRYQAMHRMYAIIIEIKIREAVEKATTIVPEIVIEPPAMPPPPPMEGPVPGSRQLPAAFEGE